MRALEILKKFSELHESAYGFNNVMVATLGDINDAIIELEAPKSCDGCKYSVVDWGCSKQAEIDCIRLDDLPDYYEPKD